jgi:hypothetical protein
MATWTPIDTTTVTTSYEFALFANLAFAEGGFADGLVYDPWGLINTTQSSNWGVITTVTVGADQNFATFANTAYAEGAFADGIVYDPWTLISTN